jgi:hypothetical protein
VDESNHRVATRFDFKLPRNTAVFVCARVREGAPILYVSHDAEGGWQFLCGGQHDEGNLDGAALVCLECTVADDPTLNDLATLDEDWEAQRESPGAPWRLHDRAEDFIVAAVERFGWAVQLVEEGESEAEPAFAYTVGLHKSFGAAELIVFGLGREVMHAMLNVCGERIKAGETLPVGTPFEGVLDDFPVMLRHVRAAESFRDHVGYALWFNKGHIFPLLQLVWPDKAGRFPGEEGANPRMSVQQPLLP